MGFTPASTRPFTGVRTPSTKENKEVEPQAMPQIPSIFFSTFFLEGEYEIPGSDTLVTSANVESVIDTPPIFLLDT